jgi:hypothetical protein
MLAALNLGAVALGVAAGGLAASLLALILGGALSLAGADWGADVGLVVGILVGLWVGGWIAGARAVHSSRFHGEITGLALAFLIMLISRLGGSNAGSWTVLWLAVVSLVVAGLAGWLAGRRKASRT